jgi:hypothetical protein
MRNPHATAFFRDIPAFTQRGVYEIDVSWVCVDSTMATWATDQLVDTDPDYQRAHVWTPEQQVRYVEYIMRGGYAAREIYWNCTTWGSGWNTPVELVDGKQRLEAVRRFMRNEIPAFGHVASNWDVLDMMTCRMRWYVNDLKTRREVLQWYLDLNSGGVVHTSTELDRVRELLDKELIAK